METYDLSSPNEEEQNPSNSHSAILCKLTSVRKAKVGLKFSFV